MMRFVYRAGMNRAARYDVKKRTKNYASSFSLSFTALRLDLVGFTCAGADFVV